MRIEPPADLTSTAQLGAVVLRASPTYGEPDAVTLLKFPGMALMTIGTADGSIQRPDTVAECQIFAAPSSPTLRHLRR